MTLLFSIQNIILCFNLLINLKNTIKRLAETCSLLVLVYSYIISIFEFYCGCLFTNGMTTVFDLYISMQFFLLLFSPLTTSPFLIKLPIVIQALKLLINPLKTKRRLLYSYRAVNTFRLGYKPYRFVV
jgi:hypothetical protein